MAAAASQDAQGGRVEVRPFAEEVQLLDQEVTAFLYNASRVVKSSMQDSDSRQLSRPTEEFIAEMNRNAERTRARLGRLEAAVARMQRELSEREEEEGGEHQ